MEERVLGGEEVAKALRELLKKRSDVVLAYLFGSLASEGRTRHDVDLAVAIKSEDKLSVIASLIGAISRELRIQEDRVDVVDIERADLDLKFRVLTEGIKLIDREGSGEALEREACERYPALNEELSIASRLGAEEDPEIDERLMLKRIDEVLRDSTMMRERYLNRGSSWILGDLERSYAFERAFHRMIEAMMDVCRHVVSTKRLGTVLYYSDYPLRIAEANLMSKELAERISELAKLRNILVHQYVDLDYDLFLGKAEEVVRGVVPEFTEWARGLMKPS